MGRDDGGGVGPDWFRTWAAGWLRTLRRKNRSENTIRTAAVYLRDFGGHLLVEEVTGPELLTREHLHRWQDGIRVRLLPTSQHVAVSAIRGLLKWADMEELSPRPALWMWLDSPHVPEALPRPLEPSELAAIVTHFARPSRDLVRLRDRALFWFLVTTGCRISEALQVRVDQLAGGLLTVRKKGGDEHVLVMSELARRWVADYLRARGRDQVAALWIHVGRRGRRPLRDDQVNDIWTALAEQLKLRRFTSHQLKHTGVTELGDDTESDDAIAKHVGWKSAQMMRRYRKLRDPKRQAMVDQLDDLVPDVPTPPPRPRRRRYRVVDGKRPA